MSIQDPTDKSEMRLTGLILTQSLLIGAAVGIYDAGIWLPGGKEAGHYVNGITYAMGALAVQILAYYLFKMFFEEQITTFITHINLTSVRCIANKTATRLTFLLTSPFNL